MSNTPPLLKPAPGGGARRERAWTLVIANQLALPGIGSVIAGRKVGYAQLCFSFSGVICLTAFLFFALPRMGDWLNPPEEDAQVWANLENWKPWLGVAFLGLALVAVGWCWALVTSTQVLKQSQGPAATK